MPAKRNLHDCRAAVIEALSKVGIVNAELDARLLICHALDISDVAYFTGARRILSETEEKRLDALLQRRLAREPVSRIIGRRGFWKHDFQLSGETLDPRPDSETLIEVVLEWIDVTGKGERPLRLLDLGTGTGALLLSLLLELPQATGVGVDISAEAVTVAAQNAATLGCNTRAQFCYGHWFDDLEETFDIIVCNPPYIPTKAIEGLEPEVTRFDPYRALDGGPDGLSPYRELLPKTAMHLRPDGLACFEFGAGQHDQVTLIAEDAGLLPVGGDNGLFRDLGGHWRVIALQAPAG